MPQTTTIQCPGCKAHIKVPDAMLGKKVKCPGCSRQFVAAPPEEEIEEFEEVDVEPEPEEDYERQDRKPAGSRDKKKEAAEKSSDAGSDTWASVSTGATLHLMANACLAGGMLMGLIVYTIRSTSSGGSGLATFLHFLEQLIAVSTLVGFVLALVAVGYFTQGPATSRGVAVALLVLTTLLLVLALATAFIPGRGPDPGLPPGMRSMGGPPPHQEKLPDWLRLTVFGFCLSAIASRMPRRQLAGGMSVFAMVSAACLGFLYFLDLIIYTFVTLGQGLAITMKIVNDVGQLGLVVWGLVQLMSLGKAARRLS